MANEPPSDCNIEGLHCPVCGEDERRRPNEPPFNCPGGVGINVDTVHHLAQCPGPCGTWFTTMMDEPVFPPHRVSGTTIHWDFRRG